MAECSLSMGSSTAPPSRTACKNTSPPTTKASLLASIKRLPARAAAIQGDKPAAPTIAAITASTCGAEATSSKAAAPQRTCTDKPSARTRSANCRPADSCTITATSGLKRAHWANIKST